jgi:hypothetical protein
MVLHAVDSIQVAVFVLYYSPDIPEELLSVGLCQHWPSVLCAKDDLIDDLGIGAHVVSGIWALRAWLSFLFTP